MPSSRAVSITLTQCCIRAASAYLLYIVQASRMAQAAKQDTHFSPLATLISNKRTLNWIQLKDDALQMIPSLPLIFTGSKKMMIDTHHVLTLQTSQGHSYPKDNKFGDNPILHLFYTKGPRQTGFYMIESELKGRHYLFGLDGRECGVFMYTIPIAKTRFPRSVNYLLWRTSQLHSNIVIDELAPVVIGTD